MSPSSPNPPADGAAPRPATLALLALLLASAFFALGWCTAQRSADRGAHPPPTPSVTTRPPATDRSDAVQIIVDAGALGLLPDAALRLEPIAPPRIDTGEARKVKTRRE